MSIKSGSLSFRMFRRNRINEVELVKQLAAKALPPLNTVGDSQIVGWVTGRHAADRQITADTAIFGGHLLVGLTVVEKKVPASLMQAECRMEELATLAAQGEERLSAATRSDIRKGVHTRLQAAAQPTLRTIDLAFVSDKLAIATCTTDTQQDALLIHYMQAAAECLYPIRMETLHPQLRDWGPVSYTPELEDDCADAMPGAEFLTWLWFLAEARGGMIEVPTGTWALMVEGPLLMGMEGVGAHEALLRKGEPMLSAEVKAALLAGKKLRRAKLSLARGDELWSCTIDHELTIRGLKLPETEKLDAVSRFQTRMAQVNLYVETLTALVAEFASRRGSPSWPQEREDIRAWVAKRKARK